MTKSAAQNERLKTKRPEDLKTKRRPKDQKTKRPKDLNTQTPESQHRNTETPKHQTPTVGPSAGLPTKREHFRARRFKTTQKIHEKTPKRGNKKENCGSHTIQAPPEGRPRTLDFGPERLSAKLTSASHPNWPKLKFTKKKIIIGISIIIMIIITNTVTMISGSYDIFLFFFSFLFLFIYLFFPFFSVFQFFSFPFFGRSLRARPHPPGPRPSGPHP